MKKSLTLVLLVALSACSTNESRTTASGSKAYLQTTANQTIQVPAELNKPITTDRYAIPAVGAAAAVNMGNDLPVSSVQLVRPLAAGTYIEENSNEAIVVIDRLDSPLEVNEYVWNMVDGYALQNQLTVANQVQFARVIQKSYRDNMDALFSLATDEAPAERVDFLLTLVPEGNGRVARLKVELLAAQTANGEALSVFVQRDLAFNLLNDILTYANEQDTRTKYQRIARIRDGVDSQIIINDKGQTQLVAAENYDVIWSKVLLVLRKLDFDVKDLDKSTGLLTLNYLPDNSWWDNLFGDESLALEEGAYNMQLITNDNGTAITLTDKDGQALADSTLQQLFSAMQSLLAEDNLDI